MRTLVIIIIFICFKIKCIKIMFSMLIIYRNNFTNTY